MAHVYRTLQSVLDVTEIAAYIAQDSLSASDQWVDVLTEKLVMLAETPALGRRRPRLAKQLRSFPYGHYMIFYRIRPDGIEVIRVLHGARLTSRQQFQQPQ